MTNKELVLNMLAELSTSTISAATDPLTFDDHIDVAKQGGSIARNARLELEQRSGEKIVTALNAKRGVQLAITVVLRSVLKSGISTGCKSRFFR